MEKELTRYLLQYLPDHHFKTKAAMARQIGSTKRAIQLLLNGKDESAGKSLLGKAMLYCAESQIALDPVLCAFITESSQAVRELRSEDMEAA